MSAPFTPHVIPETPLTGAALLDEVAEFLDRFVAFPSADALCAVTLWAAHAHLISSCENTARLALLSPEPGSGKTRVLEVLELLCPRPMHVLNASPAAIFRTIEKAPPTLLLDECDTIFTRKGKDDDHQDLRGLLNSGYRAGATIPRCVGPQHEVRLFPTFCAVALAGLGDLPDTVMTRSVIVRMRRRAPGETVEPFRRRLHAGEGDRLRTALEVWAAQIEDRVRHVYPELPAGITDRPADVWEPLVAVADAAGGRWPELARAACVALVKAAQTVDSGSLGLRLLTDVRTVFADADRMSTEEILAALRKLPEAPWEDLRGRPLDARGLARRLHAYEIGSTKVKIADSSVRGYRREDLHDAWVRYLPPDPAQAEPPEPAEPPTDQRRSATHTAVPLEVPLDPAVPEPQVSSHLAVPEPKPQVEPAGSPLTCTSSAGSAPAGTGESALHLLNAELGATPLHDNSRGGGPS